MLTARSSKTTATDRGLSGRRLIAGKAAAAVVLLMGLASVLVACAPQQQAEAPATVQTPPPPPPPQLPPILPFDQAVANAANRVFASAAVARSGAIGNPVVIDPLVDGVTGEQSRATQSIQERIAGLVEQHYPQFVVEPFSPQSLNGAPLVLVGTFTPVDAQGKTAGTRTAYRFCLVLGDLRSGKIIAKAVARAQLTGVDDTPLPAFAESPAWSPDRASQGYINTCQASKVGDPIDKVYLDGILTAAIVSRAIDAYDNGRYQEALDLYNNAEQTPAGNQLRVYNGIYLSNFRLGRREAATDAFAQLVGYGFKTNRLAVKILFVPGSATFLRDAEFSDQYPLWLRQIADQAAESPLCIDVTGHTSATGSPALNERLSLLRAQYVKSRLDADAPQITSRTVAEGMGSNELLIGTGRDDASDALDRRVEFKLRPSCEGVASTG
jgi:outer membrane protein OmpA-like peptidoglycan-associated protein